MLKNKTFTIIFSVVSIFICVMNHFGYDFKGYIFFLSSPPLWLMKTDWFADNFGEPDTIPILFKYILTVSFWSFIGERIDYIR